MPLAFTVNTQETFTICFHNISQHLTASAQITDLKEPSLHKEFHSVRGLSTISCYDTDRIFSLKKETCHKG